MPNLRLSEVDVTALLGFLEADGRVPQSKDAPNKAEAGRGAAY
jgi:hypothetical protein